jgi:ring-1,2-phenylacetyl-CoA epoxidase subunit PaaE
MALGFHPLRIARHVPLTRDANLIEFELPEAARAEFTFRPGQHVTLRAVIGGCEERRSYSLCSVPGEPLQIVVKRVDEGIFSGYVHETLVPGMTIDVMPPSGQFVIDLDPLARRHHLAIAAGSGITPVISLVRSILESEPESHVTLLYGNRSSSSVIFRELLGALKDRFLKRLSLLFVLSREHSQVPLFDGRIDYDKIRALCATVIDARQLHGAYLCGPYGMIEACQKALLAAGLARERIKSELFGTAALASRPQSARSAVARECHVTIRLDGQARRFSMARDSLSVLDAALAQGIDLPFSCKSGVCSTCRCKRISGKVEMDANFALEDYEVARGFVLCCQSFPVSDELELDYDQQS